MQDNTRPSGLIRGLLDARRLEEFELSRDGPSGRGRGTRYEEALRAARGMISDVAEHKGAAYAEVLELRFVQGMTWAAIAERVSYSERYVQDMAARALAWLDEHAAR